MAMQAQQDYHTKFLIVSYQNEIGLMPAAYLKINNRTIAYTYSMFSHKKADLFHPEYQKIKDFCLIQY